MVWLERHLWYRNKDGQNKFIIKADKDGQFHSRDGYTYNQGGEPTDAWVSPLIALVPLSSVTADSFDTLEYYSSETCRCTSHELLHFGCRCGHTHFLRKRNTTAEDMSKMVEETIDSMFEKL